VKQLCSLAAAEQWQPCINLHKHRHVCGYWKLFYAAMSFKAFR